MLLLLVASVVAVTFLAALVAIFLVLVVVAVFAVLVVVFVQCWAKSWFLAQAEAE